MTDQPKRKTPRQRRAAERRYYRVMDRLNQRWARAFRRTMIASARLSRGRRHPRGYIGAFLDEIRRV